MARRKETERVGDKPGRTQKNEKKEPIELQRLKQKCTDTSKKKGAKGGESGKNKGELLIVASEPAIVKENAPDKIKCHHLGRDWQVPWLISHKGHTGCHPPSPPTFIKIHHRCPEWDSSEVNHAKEVVVDRNVQASITCSHSRSQCNAFSLYLCAKQRGWLKLSEWVEQLWKRWNSINIIAFIHGMFCYSLLKISWILVVILSYKNHLYNSNDEVFWHVKNAGWWLIILMKWSKSVSCVLWECVIVLIPQPSPQRKRCRCVQFTYCCQYCLWWFTVSIKGENIAAAWHGLFIFGTEKSVILPVKYHRVLTLWEGNYYLTTEMKQPTTTFKHKHNIQTWLLILGSTKLREQWWSSELESDWERGSGIIENKAVSVSCVDGYILKHK